MGAWQSFNGWMVNRFFRQAVQKAAGQQLRLAQRNSEPPGRRGLVDGYQQVSTSEGQLPATDPMELLDRYALQPGLRAPVDKVAKIVSTCAVRVALVEGQSESPADLAYLRALVERPNGNIPFSVIVFETVARLKVCGECAWEWIWADASSLAAGQQAAQKALLSVMLTAERGRLKSMTVPEARIKALAATAEQVAARASARQAKRPVGFRVLQGIVNPIVDKHGEFIDYDRAYVQIVASGDRAFFGINDVLWMRGPNALGGVHALAPFESVRFVDDVDQKVQVYTNALLDNRGELGGVITVKNPAHGEIERIYRELENRHRGPENAGKWHVIGVEENGDTKVDKFSLPPMEVEAENAAVRRLRLMWSVLNVPGGKVGFINDVNRANIEMQDKALLEEEVGPLCSMIADPFNQFLKVTLGITSYQLRFAAADLRTENDRLDNQRKRLEQGVITLNDMLREQGGEEAMVQDGDVRLLVTRAGTLVFSADRPALLITSSGAVPLFGGTTTGNAGVLSGGGAAAVGDAPPSTSGVATRSGNGKG